MTDIAFMFDICVRGAVIPLLRTPLRVGRSLPVAVVTTTTGTLLVSNPKTIGRDDLLGRMEPITLSPLSILPAVMLTLMFLMNLRATSETPLPEAEWTLPRLSILPREPLRIPARPALTLLVSVFGHDDTITTMPVLNPGNSLNDTPISENILNTVTVTKMSEAAIGPPIVPSQTSTSHAHHLPIAIPILLPRWTRLFIITPVLLVTFLSILHLVFTW